MQRLLLLCRHTETYLLHLLVKFTIFLVKSICHCEANLFAVAISFLFPPFKKGVVFVLTNIGGFMFRNIKTLALTIVQALPLLKGEKDS